MKTLAFAFGVAVVASSATGCVSASQSARMYAAAEFRCPASQVQVEEIPGGTLRAHGCGRQAFYIDNSAPSADQGAQPDANRTYWRLARGATRR